MSQKSKNDIIRNTDPLKGPPDWVEALIKCNVASMQAMRKSGGKPVPPTVMNCKIFASYDEGTLGLSIDGISRIINLRLDEVMTILQAAAEASKEFIATLPQYTDEELEEKWVELRAVPLDDADSPSGYILAEEWWIFPAGADLDDVQKWIGSRHSKGIKYLETELKA